MDTQRIYHRQHLSVADYFMSFQQALRDEFVSGYNSVAEAAMAAPPSMDTCTDLPQKVRDYLVQDIDGTPDMARCRVQGLKYVNAAENVYWQETSNEVCQRFPTAMQLIRQYGDDCLIVNYTALAPRSVVNRHTDTENSLGEYIRIHVPLFTPEGKLFIEVNGEVAYWDDIFAFNNQFLHSAHNHTNEWWVGFMFDIRRECIGLPPGAHYEDIKYLNTAAQAALVEHGGIDPQPLSESNCFRGSV